MRQIGPLFGLVPTRDHRLAAPSKNYRYSANVQVAIDADTRLVIATGDAHPGNAARNGSDLPAWQEDLNAGHRKIRARVEHAQARMKCWKILRDYRRAVSTLNDTVSNILLTD